MTKQIDYFMTPVSPYVYMGNQRFAEIAQKHGAQVNLKPVDMGKVFAVSGGLPLSQRPPQRQAYRLVELKRWSQFLGVPLNLEPAHFPVSADAAAKLIIATQLAHGTARALVLAGAIGRAVWAEQRNIADAETLVRIAGENDLDGAALLKASEGHGVQAAFDANTQEAISASVFGAPWYIYNGEAFWGQDRLEFLDRALAST